MNAFLNRELELFLAAVGFFTRIPVPMKAEFSEADLNHAARYFPLVGVLIGVIAALVYTAVSEILPRELAILASMATTIYATGAFHEDGLTDAIDGLGGGWEKEQVLTIMQDSRIGSFGAIGLFLVLLAKYEALVHTFPAVIPAVLIAGHALSRLASVLVITTQPYVKARGKAKPLATQLSKGELAIAAVFGLGPLVLFIPKLLVTLLPVVVVWCWFSYKLKKRLGGYTGDCLGAMQQLCELAFYLGVAAWSFT
ncbi:MAG TPA: adenosylcobinamide-GDP ribazoletransferase [Methylophilaceae bacterium]|nr:adenosylcobinamide-GDP ribazoletransferase [Methylophilaceae bacterium]